MWEIEFTHEFDAWWKTLSNTEQDSVRFSIDLLAERGPQLARPHVDTIKGSRHANLKELRSQCRGAPLRTFFAFDPRRIAILLIGGDKSNRLRFYKELVFKADRLYDQHLEQLRKRGVN